MGDNAVLELPANVAQAVKTIGAASGLNARPDTWRAAAGGQLPSDEIQVFKDKYKHEVKILSEIVQANPAGGEAVKSGILVEHDFSKTSKNGDVYTTLYLDNPNSQVLFGGNVTNRTIRVPQPFSLKDSRTGEVELPVSTEAVTPYTNVFVKCPKNGSCELDFKNLQQGRYEGNKVYIDGGVGQVITGPNTKGLYLVVAGYENRDKNKRLTISLPATSDFDMNGYLGVESMRLQSGNNNIHLENTVSNADLRFSAPGKDGKIHYRTIPLKDENGFIANDQTLDQLKKTVEESRKNLLDQAAKAKAPQLKQLGGS